MRRHSRPTDPLFPSGPGLGSRALVLGLLCCVLWFGDQRGLMALDGLRSGLSAAAQPFLWLSQSPRALVDTAGEFRNLRGLVGENRRLKEELAIVHAQLVHAQGLEVENQRLKQLAPTQRKLRQHLVVQFLGVNQDPYRHQITLNKGSSDGVQAGQALLDAHGVMGHVTWVAPHYATALLITDPTSGIPVEVARTGLQTIARGAEGNQGLVLPFLPGNADVRRGDLLITSGLGGRYPPGYAVGVVQTTQRSTGAHFMQAMVAPSARLYRGRFGLLVWSPFPSMPLPKADQAPTSATLQLAPVSPPAAAATPPPSGAPRASPAASPAPAPAATAPGTVTPAATPVAAPRATP